MDTDPYLPWRLNLATLMCESGRICGKSGPMAEGFGLSEGTLPRYPFQHKFCASTLLWGIEGLHAHFQSTWGRCDT